MRCIRRIHHTIGEVLSRAGLPSKFTLLRERRLRWLGHVRRMDDGRIPKDILYEELAAGRRDGNWTPTAALQRCLQKEHEGPAVGN